MKNKINYPCIITKEDNIYYANFFDFNACFTDGESLDEVLKNAKEVLNGVCFVLLKDNKKLPIATKEIEKINLKKNQFIIFVEVWLAPLNERIQTTSVKKTLTIPKWLNDEASKYNINYSKLLQTAIKDYLGIN